jgi:hypothetical protein
MTIASDAGFVIGKQYQIKSGPSVGEIVTFKKDDGTDCPAFDCSREYDSDGWSFITLSRLRPVETTGAATPLKNFIIDVTDVETTVRVGKLLSADQLKRIIEILGE